MMTTEQIANGFARLPKGDLRYLRDRLDELLEAKDKQNVKRGERIRALAGAAHVGKVLDPLPSRESIYEEAAE